MAKTFIALLMMHLTANGDTTITLKEARLQLRKKFQWAGKYLLKSFIIKIQNLVSSRIQKIGTFELDKNLTNISKDAVYQLL